MAVCQLRGEGHLQRETRFLLPVKLGAVIEGPHQSFDEKSPTYPAIKFAT